MHGTNPNFSFFAIVTYFCGYTLIVHIKYLRLHVLENQCRSYALQFETL